MDNITNQLIIIKPDDLEEVKSELREIKTFLQDLFSTNLFYVRMSILAAKRCQKCSMLLQEP